MDAKVFADKLPSAVIIIDHELKLRWWNKAACYLLSLHANAENQAISDIIVQQDFLDFIADNDKDNRKKTIEFQLGLNEPITLSVAVIPYEDGFMIHMDDVTQRQQLDTMRKDFVANVSHELRTPLTVVRGYLETLTAFNDKSLTPWKSMLEQMHEQANRMERIIEDLLLLARLENNKLYAESRETIDIPALLKLIHLDAIALSGNRQHQIKLSIETEHALQGSRIEIRNAFSNIVFNAIHYTPDGGNIDIRWYTDDKGLHFSVKDSGIGIDSKHLARLTERFYRVDGGRTRTRGGTGLGLAIVKHVLIRHHATLYVESKPGSGSLFRCDFPEHQIAKGE